jgi:hypothetical protein
MKTSSAIVEIVSWKQDPLRDYSDKIHLLTRKLSGEVAC